MQLNIQSLNKTFKISLSSESLTVKDIKMIIQKSRRIPIYYQVLMYNNNQLNDNENIASYNICNGDTLRLIILYHNISYNSNKLTTPKAGLFKYL